MTAWIVVHADDLGLHPAVDDGILETHVRGVVTSASIMASGESFDHAVALCRANPTLDLGVHLTLVEERPLSRPEDVPSLVDGEGRMPPNFRAFVARWLSGRIRAADVRRELSAQVRRVLDAGLRPTHLDSHQHVHALPGVWGVAAGLAREHGIRFLRLPRFDTLRGEGPPAAGLFRAGANLLSRWHRLRWPPGVERPPALRGGSLSGRMTTARLLALLEGLGPGFHEVLVHPGRDDPDLTARYSRWGGYGWEVELEALTDPAVKARLERGDLRLTTFARGGRD